MILTNSLFILPEITFYQLIKTPIKETIESALQVEFSEADYDYVYLAYCCADNCIFTDRWCEENMNPVQILIVSSLVVDLEIIRLYL